MYKVLIGVAAVIAAVGLSVLPAAASSGSPKPTPQQLSTIHQPVLNKQLASSGSPEPTPQQLSTIHQPVLNKRLKLSARVNGGIPLYTSSNWAGYMALPGGTTTSFTKVSANYTVPSVNCTPSGTNNSFAYHWIGLDGWTDNTVEQDGVADFCEAGSPTYYSWYEMYPNSITLAFTVNSGDAITSKVTYSSGNYTLYLKDVTTGKSFSKTFTCPSGNTCNNSSAEDITEGYTVSGWEGTADYAKEFYDAFSATNQAGTSGGINSSAWSDAEVEAIGSSSNLPTSIPGSLYGGKAFEIDWQRVN
jgi:hypothetical protein